MTTQETTTEPNDPAEWFHRLAQRFEVLFQGGINSALFLLPKPRTGNIVSFGMNNQTVRMAICNEARLDCASLRPVEHTLGTDDELCAARLVAALCIVHDRDTVRAILDRAASEEPHDNLTHLSWS